jgi:nucleoid-associated protein YgaU
LLVAILGHLPGTAGTAFRHAAERVTPAAVRRVAAVLVGASLSGALAPGTATADGPDVLARVAAAAPAPSFAVTSTAAGAPSPGFAPHGSVGAAAQSAARAAEPVAAAPVASAGAPAETASPAPGWTPTRPLVRPQPSPDLLTTAPAPDERPGTVVRRGDTLWDVVRHHLGPDATDAEVAAEWPRWHDANRAVIGADPDLLLPGQVLHAPETAGALR